MNKLKRLLYPKTVARNLPKVAPITREGVNAPPEIPAPYVQQVTEKRMRKKIHKVVREKAPAHPRRPCVHSSFPYNNDINFQCRHIHTNVASARTKIQRKITNIELF